MERMSEGQSDDLPAADGGTAFASRLVWSSPAARNDSKIS